MKLCISVIIYCRLPKLGMSTHVSKLAYAMIKNERKSYVSQLISIINFSNWVWVLMFSKLPSNMIKNGI